MPVPHLARLFLLGIACILSGMDAVRAGTGPLAAFLPDEETARTLQTTVAQLESESFAEREAATDKLRALPALPPFLRELAAKETRAESGYRLRALAATFSLEQENLRLTRALREIAEGGGKGVVPGDRPG